MIAEGGPAPHETSAKAVVVLEQSGLSEIVEWDEKESALDWPLTHRHQLPSVSDRLRGNRLPGSCGLDNDGELPAGRLPYCGDCVEPWWRHPFEINDEGFVVWIHN